MGEEESHSGPAHGERMGLGLACGIGASPQMCIQITENTTSCKMCYLVVNNVFGYIYIYIYINKTTQATPFYKMRILESPIRHFAVVADLPIHRPNLVPGPDPIPTIVSGG